MPALTIIPSPIDTRSASPAASSSRSDRSDSKRSESRSPGRPPVSPITPTVSTAQLAPLEPAQYRPRVVPPEIATFRQQPPPVPISESENPDAIALRSAISLLQLQREKSKRDLRSLEELKSAAISDPQGFARSLQAQHAQKPKSDHDPLKPTLSDAADLTLTSGHGGEELRDKDGPKDAGVDIKPTASTDPTSTFSAIPQPQNIIRCPPVNWAKYHVVGEPLDKMHEEQKLYPYSKEPPRNHQGGRASPHTVASPYSPFADGIESRSQSRRGSKKPPS
ncbi:hypothetical protein EJ04DRAFT_427387 [Polyplosphaeria fusca]|uniref:Uncharacterized protein n=1 Tax=Polyplosphaeria fusca TaxID=682080 RepID=A0A9P4V7C1_9PLEO|nr:hypothetical protein EJ04DRAFT_427387 [Polyplosphaeria fusca]